MSLRERIARAIASADGEDGQVTYGQMADAVLAELAPELQPQAEPVAWLTPGGDVSRSYAWAAERCIDQDPTPLYTAPQPQASAEAAQWTDEQCREFCRVAYRHRHQPGLPTQTTLDDIRMGAHFAASLGVK